MLHNLQKYVGRGKIPALITILVPQAVPVLDEILHTGIQGGSHDHDNDRPVQDVDTGECHHGAQANHGRCGLYLAAPAGSDHIAFSYGNPLVIILIGGVYVIEGISVIMQVVIFKSTGKRIFKMAPLHHHLEKCGIAEGHICAVAMGVTILLSATAILILEMI